MSVTYENQDEVNRDICTDFEKLFPPSVVDPKFESIPMMLARFGCMPEDIDTDTGDDDDESDVLDDPVDMPLYADKLDAADYVDKSKERLKDAFQRARDKRAREESNLSQQATVKQSAAAGGGTGDTSPAPDVKPTSDIK